MAAQLDSEIFDDLRAEQVARVHQAPRLILNRRRNGRVCMAQRTDGNAADEVKVTRAAFIDKIASLAAHKRERRAIVVLKKRAHVR